MRETTAITFCGIEKFFSAIGIMPLQTDGTSSSGRAAGSTRVRSIALTACLRGVG
jgi:hypothetical protein